jgi:hypothetical protein
MTNIKIAAAARRTGLAGLIGAAAAATVVGFAGAAHAEPPAGPHNGGRMHGNPAAAVPYCHPQSGADCALMAVADVVGEIKGREQEPTEENILQVAQDTASTMHPGKILGPNGRAAAGDIPALLEHYGIHSEPYSYDPIGLDENDGLVDLADELDHERNVIAAVDPAILSNVNAQPSGLGHAVVVTGIDTAAKMVHVNDSGNKDGCDEKVPFATFEKAWAASDHLAFKTK